MPKHRPANVTVIGRGRLDAALYAPAPSAAPDRGAQQSSRSAPGSPAWWASRRATGAAGDGPCYAGGPVVLQPLMYTCDAANDLYCNRGDNVCAPRVAPEERCEFTNACNAEGMCSGGSCRRLPGLARFA